MGLARQRASDPSRRQLAANHLGQDQLIPLCVDLDGTLVKTDVLFESAAAALKAEPLLAFALPFWLLRGRAALKSELARRGEVDVSALPYDTQVLDELRRQRAAGRRIVLATAADSHVAQRVADHLGLFDEVIASDGERNLKGDAKAQALVDKFGERGFEYMDEAGHGDAIWKHAAEARVVLRERNGAAAILRELRVFQWAKNLLVFVPLVTAHAVSRGTLLAELAAFVAFSLVASSVYLLNDLADLQDDRRHSTKRMRPLAAGDVSITAALVLWPLLIAGATALAWQLPLAFGALLLLYLAINLAYSLGLKRIALLDVFVLAALYTLRILAGAAAIEVPVSHWLLAFSLFAFLSLAIVKRFVEVSGVASRDEDRVGGRGYLAGDGQLLGMLGTASAYLAVLVFALYITSPQVVVLYRSPEVLWCAVPLLLYWMSRVWFLAHRGQLHEDPVLFALRDPQSYAVGLLILLAMLAAT
ncbi:MAG TPA: UbiA family prenyltransferase [Usitatibacter sp.]